MPIKKEYTSRVDLPTDWSWGFIRDVEKFLNDRGLRTDHLTLDDQDGTTITATLDEMSAEIPNPEAHHTFGLWMKGETVEADVWSMQIDKGSECFATVSGTDQTQVLGLAEVLRRFVGGWKPAEVVSALGSSPQAQLVTEIHAAGEEALSGIVPAPLWKQGWFLELVLIVIAAATFVVMVLALS